MAEFINSKVLIHFINIVLCVGGSSRSVETGSETVSVSSSLPLTPLPDSNLLTVPLLDHLHCLWGLVLTAEPHVVFALSPAQCSATVQVTSPEETIS